MRLTVALVVCPRLSPSGRQDERELGDLRNGKTCQEAHPHRVAHHGHDRDDDQRVSDQHECREDHSLGDLSGGVGELQSRAEVEEEEQQQEVAQTDQPRAQRVANRCAGQRDPRQECSHLGAETEPFAQGGHRSGVGHPEEHEQFLGARDQGKQPGQHEPGHQPDPGEQSDPLEQNQRDPDPEVVAGVLAEGGERDHHQHDDDVLHDQEAHRDRAHACPRAA